MTLGERIKMLRQKSGMTQDELAKAIGYSTKTSVSKIENDVLDINQSTIVALARVLHTTPSVIMGWNEASASTPAAPLLSENENELVKIYRNVNEGGQSYIMQTARMVEGTEQYRKPTPKQSEEEAPILVAARSFGGDKPPEPIRLKKRPGAGSILDLPDYKGD